MIEEKRQSPTNAGFRFDRVSAVKSSSSTRIYDSFTANVPTDPMQTGEICGYRSNFGVKRKKTFVSMDCEADPACSTPPATPQPSSTYATTSGGCGGRVGGGLAQGDSSPRAKVRDGGARNLDIAVSCLEGSTMRIPLKGKTAPFRVVKRRGRGISSVVFECERERSSDEDESLPRVVTVKVMSGGESGMGSCLREVETLAFLKIKREEAGLIRAPFAELASWFYRRSSIGGVDHVCLVFRGGGVSLREAMTERSQTQAAAGVKQQSLLTWEIKDVVAVARGLLEGIAFFHSVGLIHADVKPENVVLYPMSPTSCPSPSSSVSGGDGRRDVAHLPFDLRLIDLGNSVFAADTVPGVTAGTPSYLSPEARNSMPWGPPVDVWAVGCILYEIVTGGRMGKAGDCVAHPRDGNVIPSAFGSGTGIRAIAAEGSAGEVLSRLVDLVKQLLVEDVKVRPSAADALKDPVFFCFD